MIQTDLKFSANITPSPCLPFANPPKNLAFSITITATLGTLPSHCQLPNIKGNFALHSVQSTSRAQKKYELLQIRLSVTLVTPLATIRGSRRTSQLLRKLGFLFRKKRWLWGQY